MPWWAGFKVHDIWKHDMHFKQLTLSNQKKVNKENDMILRVMMII